MFVIRQLDGTLLVPQSAARDGRVLGDGYATVGPDDDGYERLAADAISEEEAAARRVRWRDGDEALRQRVLERARSARQPEPPGGAGQDAAG